MKHPLLGYFLLLRPDTVRANVEAAGNADVIDCAPNTWQLCLGALRMWHRILSGSETIGTSSGPPPRKTLRARLLNPRLFRLPPLLAEGAVAPWDLTGLLSSPDRITRHLLAANQFVFDLQLLASHPGRLEALIDEVEKVVAGQHPRGEWLRDLTVYSGYHESLLEAARGASQGDFKVNERKLNDPDLTLTGLLRWCARAPTSPRQSLTAWRRSEFHSGEVEAAC